MLVVTRKPNDAVLIGDNVRITVVSVRGGSVKIGIEAPPHVRILRDELSGELAPLACTSGGKSSE